MLNEKSRNLLSKKPGYIYTVFILLDADAEKIDINKLVVQGEKKEKESIEEIFENKFF